MTGIDPTGVIGINTELDRVDLTAAAFATGHIEINDVIETIPHHEDAVAIVVPGDDQTKSQVRDIDRGLDIALRRTDAGRAIGTWCKLVDDKVVGHNLPLGQIPIEVRQS